MPVDLPAASSYFYIGSIEHLALVHSYGCRGQDLVPKDTVTLLCTCRLGGDFQEGLLLDLLLLATGDSLTPVFLLSVDRVSHAG